MDLRSVTLAMALILTTLPAWQAGALPAKSVKDFAEPQLVHHKPWHRGGPPWLRRDNRGSGGLDGWERRRSFGDAGRRGLRQDYRYEEWVERPRRSYRFDDDY